MKHFFKLLVRDLGSKSDTHSNMLVTITNRDTNKNFHLKIFKKKKIQTNSTRDIDRVDRKLFQGLLVYYRVNNSTHFIDLNY
jgi:hypothetical protein